MSLPFQPIATRNRRVTPALHDLGNAERWIAAPMWAMVSQAIDPGPMHRRKPGSGMMRKRIVRLRSDRNSA